MISFLLNGAPMQVDAGADTPLLYVLRNQLGLMGARFGCGLGLCGACFVHIDGVSAPSCDTPMWSVDGKNVVTVEGLSPHPLQEAFLEEQAAQCGYCVTGIVMTAAALLERDPHPSQAAVAEALDRHLCRCGAQQRMIRAVIRASENAAVTAATNPAVKTGEEAAVTAGEEATVTAGEEATVTAGEEATVTAGEKATVKAGEEAAANTEHDAAGQTDEDAAVRVAHHAAVMTAETVVDAGEKNG